MREGKDKSSSAGIQIRIFDAKRQKEEVEFFLRSRKKSFPEDVLESARKIVEEVKKYGDRALFNFTKQFDGFELSHKNLEVSREEIEEGFKRAGRKLTRALKTAAQRIRSFHEKFLLKTAIYEDELGCLLGQLVRPVERAGIYVPGGRANYPSTVLMNVIPAQVAGVKEIYVCVPPDREGRISTATLAALYIVNPTRVFRIGGAQAIAAMAYGTESVPAVDVIAGPGNIYVAAAKKLVFGDVGVDMIAGPSEVAIIADTSAEPKFLARDLMAQAEHDSYASSFLLTPSKNLIEEVLKELQRLVSDSKRKETISESLKNNGAFFLVEDLEAAVELANAIAPEHLELEVEDPFELLAKVRSAGAVFLGKNTAESFGDYILGPNHTLPTQTTARFSSPLSANTFVKTLNVAMASQKAVGKLYPYLKEIALSEGLFEHERSAYERFKKLKQR